MNEEKKLCINCSVQMKKSYVKYKGIELEALECPKCKSKIFTEDLTMKALSKIESKRLEEEYVRKTIKIGSSIGITFPRDIVEAFNINDETKVKIHPKLSNGKIEMAIS
ncbi:MAG: hypothetical protein AABY09_01465 [Nanoarchaeota archaeon]